MNRPKAESHARVGTIKILLSPASKPVSKSVTALIFQSWCVHEYHGQPGRDGFDGGFSVSYDGLSLNEVCPDLEWHDACRLALRLAADFPDPDVNEIDTQLAIISAVAETLAES